MDARVDGDASRRSDSGLRRVAIGSYNVHSCVGWDRRRAPSRIAAVLKELDCDIYALQEVDNEQGDGEDSMQLEYLSRALEMAAVPGLRIVRHSGEYGNALLTRLPIVSVHRHDLSYSWFEPRGALDVQLDLGDHKLRVIATHLGLSRSERRAQWRHLLKAVAAAPRGAADGRARRHERVVAVFRDAARRASASWVSRSRRRRFRRSRRSWR